LAAAKQAALLGSRGIAFSTNVSDNHEPDLSALEPHIAKVLDLLMPNKTLSLVNVNLPDKPKGIRWTRQSVRHYDGKVVPDKDPMGRSIFWFTVTPLEGAAKGTDRWAIEHHWVSITPLRLDLTDQADLARALAVSDTPVTKVSGKRRQRRRSSSKSKSSSRAQK
jgi:5'-nucleotidase